MVPELQSPEHSSRFFTRMQDSRFGLQEHLVFLRGSEVTSVVYCLMWALRSWSSINPALTSSIMTRGYFSMYSLTLLKHSAGGSTADADWRPWEESKDDLPQRGPSISASGVDLAHVPSRSVLFCNLSPCSFTSRSRTGTTQDYDWITGSCFFLSLKYPFRYFVKHRIPIFKSL